MLRTAFDRTMQDPRFREDARKIRIELDPGKGETLERVAREIYASSPETIARAKELIASTLDAHIARRPLGPIAARLCAGSAPGMAIKPVTAQATNEARTSRAGKRPPAALQRLQRAARGPARVHQARRGSRRDHAHQGRRPASRNGHARRDREPRPAGGAGDPVRGRAGLSEGHAADLRRDQFVEAARDHDGPAGAVLPARRGEVLSRAHADAQADPAQDRAHRRGVRERRPRRRRRPAEIPGAVPAREGRRPLHGHRRSRDHARSRRRLDQRRHLSLHGAATRTTSRSTSHPASKAGRSARNIMRPASPARC